MRYLRTYENYDGPEVGDFVLCTDKTTDKYEKNYIESLIGKMVEYREKDEEGDLDFPYLICFPGISRTKRWKIYKAMFHSDRNCKSCRWFKRSEIIFWSKDLETVKTFKIAKKYNL